jgi:sulfur-oxidizing protein SoxY
MERRKALQLVAALAAAGVFRPGALFAQEWNQAAFEVKSLSDAMKALGAQSPGSSDAIAIKAPEIAENGAVVPIAIESRLPNTESISLLIEKNPQPLAASFAIPKGTDALVSTRVKMGQSSDVYALVKADGKFYVAKKEIKITLGGCGG